jgi:hypothetical protein
MAPTIVRQQWRPIRPVEILFPVFQLSGFPSSHFPVFMVSLFRDNGVSGL